VKTSRKQGWFCCFFNLKVHCAYFKHWKNAEITEKVAIPILKHSAKFEENTFRGKKVLTVTYHLVQGRAFWIFTESEIACAFRCSTHRIPIESPRLDLPEFCSTTFRYLSFHRNFCWTNWTRKNFLHKLQYAKNKLNLFARCPRIRPVVSSWLLKWESSFLLLLQEKSENHWTCCCHLIAALCAVWSVEIKAKKSYSSFCHKCRRWALTFAKTRDARAFRCFAQS